MAREHHHPAGSSNRSRPFDVEHHAAGELTEQFWGDTRSWTPVTDDADPDAPTDVMWAERTGSLRAIRDGLVGRRPRATDSGRIAGARSAAQLSGGFDRTRSHGIVRPGALRPDDRTDQLPRTGQTARVAVARGDVTLGQLASGADVDWTDDDWDLLPANPTGSTGRIASTPAPRVWQAEIELDDRRRPAARPGGIGVLAERLGLGAVDPLLMRLGVLVLIGALAVPVAFGLGDGGSGALAGSSTPTGEALTVASSSAPPTAAQAGSTVDAVAALPEIQVAADSAPAAPSQVVEPTEPVGAETAPTASTSPAATTVPEVSETVASPSAEAATVSAQAARLEPECALEYEAAPGDSWYRIADAAGITVDDLLDANLAQLDAPIYPGDEICLPEGATMPAPPTTTVAPSTTSAPTSTVAPTTTATSTTVPSSPSALASPEEVRRLIREIWPAELHEKALQVAWRESNYRANAYNGWCCYGVFQIYWTVHRSWLDDVGIDTVADLYDARKNITAAYALYQRSGGWGPWGG